MEPFDVDERLLQQEKALRAGYIKDRLTRFKTKLSPEEQVYFDRAVSGGFFAPMGKDEINDALTDYDYEGFYHGLLNNDPKAKTEINKNDARLHYDDKWKTPYHESFSNESQYANPKTAPRWNDLDQLIDPITHEIVFDERKKNRK